MAKTLPMASPVESESFTRTTDTSVLKPVVAPQLRRKTTAFRDESGDTTVVT